MPFTIFFSRRTKAFSVELCNKKAALISFLLLFVTAVSVTGYFHLFSKAYEKYDNWFVKRKNTQILCKIGNVQAEIERLESRMKTLFTFHDRVRTMFDLAEIDHEIRQVGIGGITIGTGLDAHLEQINRQIQFEKSMIAEAQYALNSKMKKFHHMPIVFPVNGRITSGFGSRVHPILERTAFHEGIDIANKNGTKVCATADGTVTRVGYGDFAGRYVLIDHGYGFSTFYAHLSRAHVQQGENVKRYQEIGTMGESGRATGPHLHYEVRVSNVPMNPMNYLLPSEFVVD